MDVNKLRGFDADLGNHMFLAKSLDIPMFITMTQDQIFEGLSRELGVEWTERLLSAIKPGTDLTPSLLLYMSKIRDLLPEEDRVLHFEHTDIKAIFIYSANYGNSTFYNRAERWKEIADLLIESIEEVTAHQQDENTL